MPERRIDGPRRVRSGIKLETREGPVGTTWLGERWLALVGSMVPPQALSAGFEYARLGQVVSLELEHGRVKATVQGTMARPYDTTMTFAAPNDQDWERVIGAMSNEAVYSAKLLAGELPSSIEQLFASLDLALVPRAEHVRMECTCAGGGCCKHNAAIAHLIAERLDREPLILLALLGMPAPTLLERLRRSRAIAARGEATAHGDAAIPGSQAAPVPLEACIEDFWRAGPELADLAKRTPQHHAPHALLRRLGPSPIKGKFPMVGLLASVYDSVARYASALREGAKSQAED